MKSSGDKKRDWIWQHVHVHKHVVSKYVIPLKDSMNSMKIRKHFPNIRMSPSYLHRSRFLKVISVTFSLTAMLYNSITSMPGMLHNSKHTIACQCSTSQECIVYSIRLNNRINATHVHLCISKILKERFYFFTMKNIILARQEVIGRFVHSTRLHRNSISSKV